MKKHLIKGLLVLAISLVGAGTLSSCKDTNEDSLVKLEGEQAVLQTKINDLASALETLRQAQEACKAACEAKQLELEAALKNLETVMNRDFATKAELDAAKAACMAEITKVATDLATLRADHEALSNTVTSLSNTVSILQNDITSIKGDIVTINGELVNLNSLITTVQTLALDAQNKAQQALDDLVSVHTDIANINTTIANLTTTITNLSNTIEGLRPDIKNGVDAWNWIQNNKHRVDALETIVYNLAAQDQALQTIIDNVKADLQGKIDTINTKITELENKLNNLESTVASNYNTLNAALTALTTRVEANENGILNLTTLVSALTGRVDNLESSMTDVQNRVSALETALAGLATKAEVAALAAEIADLASRMTTAENLLTDLTARVAANETAIADLQATVNDLLGLADRLNKLVTGIIIQAAESPVLGYLNLPIDAQLNALMCYHGVSENSYTFPSLSTIAEYDNAARISAQDFANLALAGNFEPYKFEAGDYLLDNVGLAEGQGYAGRVYVTINPSNVDFTGVELPIVNSQDGECGIKLTGLRKSNKLLTFGYTRAANNGFYEADAYIVPADITSTRFTFEGDIKSQVKEALKNKKQNDFLALAKVIFSNFNNRLPAYGLKAAWTAPDGAGNMKDYSVFSEYKLAATTFKPFSFKTLKDYSAPYSLPIITPISDMTFDVSKFSFNFTAPTINIGGVDLNFSLKSIDINYTGTIDVVISTPQFDTSGKFTGYADVTYQVTGSSLDAFITEIEKSFNSQKTLWETEIKDAFKKAVEDLTAEINAEVKKAFDAIATDINDDIQDMITDVFNDLKGRLDVVDPLINRYNAAANKINKFLDHPNFYLQVMSVYKAGDGEYRQLSNSKDMPSPFVLGSGNAVHLYLTTYTGEVVAPAVKKFVGVTNVWNNATGNDASVDATCKQLLIDANKSEFFNKAISGKTHRVPLKVSKAGYTYEIVYSALDYLGYTSTRKFYVQVK